MDKTPRYSSIEEIAELIDVYDNDNLLTRLRNRRSEDCQAKYAELDRLLAIINEKLPLLREYAGYGSYVPLVDLLKDPYHDRASAVLLRAAVLFDLPSDKLDLLREFFRNMNRASHRGDPDIDDGEEYSNQLKCFAEIAQQIVDISDVPPLLKDSGFNLANLGVVGFVNDICAAMLHLNIWHNTERLRDKINGTNSAESEDVVSTMRALNNALMDIVLLNNKSMSEQEESALVFPAKEALAHLLDIQKPSLIEMKEQPDHGRA